MIWRSLFHRRVAQILDFLTPFAGYLLAYFCWELIYSLGYIKITRPFEIHNFHYLELILFSLLFVFLNNQNMAYSYQRFTSLITEIGLIIRVNTYIMLMMISISYFFGDFTLARSFVLIAFVINTVLFCFQKAFVYFFAGLLRKRGYNRKRVLLIGTGSRAKQFIEKVTGNFKWGLDIIGLLTGDEEKVGEKFYDINVLDIYDNIEKVLKEYNPEEVIITISTKRFDHIRNILEACEKIGAQVRLNSDFFGHLTKKVSLDNVFGLNIISFYFTRQNEFALLIKRMIDMIASGVALLILLPIFFIISFLIFIQDGFPIFYQWKVVGQNRKPFTSWKFRTMVKNADELKKQLMATNEMTGPMFKMTNDPRILPIGHFLRKYSIDELPQLFSVFIGDLSLVGPRPPLQYEFKEFDLWHRRKLSVKPGLTCLWQISGRNDIKSFDEWAKLDLEYIDNWSLLLDLKILLKTIPVVLTGKGAK